MEHGLVIHAAFHKSTLPFASWNTNLTVRTSTQRCIVDSVEYSYEKTDYSDKSVVLCYGFCGVQLKKTDCSDKSVVLYYGFCGVQLPKNRTI